MKKQTMMKTMLFVAALTIGGNAQAVSLTTAEVNTVRSVLRALNIDESKLSDKEIEIMSDQGNHLSIYQKVKSKI